MDDDQSLFGICDQAMARHPQNYADQLRNTKLKDSNQYFTTYKIDYRSQFTLFHPFNIRKFKFSSSKTQCLISFFYALFLIVSSFQFQISNAQQILPTGPNQNPLQSQSPRTVATKYGIVRGTIITLPNLNLQQVEAFLGKLI